MDLLQKGCAEQILTGRTRCPPDTRTSSLVVFLSNRVFKQIFHEVDRSVGESK